MKVFLPNSLRKDVEEKIISAHEVYAKEVVPKVHGIANLDKKTLELCRNLDFEYQLEAVYLLLGEQKYDKVLITSARFLGYKYCADPEPIKIDLEFLKPIREGAKPVGILHSHPINSVFSKTDLDPLQLLENALRGCNLMMLYDERTGNFSAVDANARKADIFLYDEMS